MARVWARTLSRDACPIIGRQHHFDLTSCSGAAYARVSYYHLTYPALCIAFYCLGVAYNVQIEEKLAQIRQGPRKHSSQTH